MRTKNIAPPPPAPVRNAAGTRERILTAARTRFSQNSFENVGTREIAADAGVDAALVNRYFGGKDNLFAEVITGGFALHPDLAANLGTLGTALVEQVLGADERGKRNAPAGLAALSVLLCATGNPPIAALVSERFHEEFVRPLAKLLRGRDTEVRAALIASQVIGLATLRHGLGSPVLSGAGRKKAGAMVAESIQAYVG